MSLSYHCLLLKCSNTIKLDITTLPSFSFKKWRWLKHISTFLSFRATLSCFLSRVELIFFVLILGISSHSQEGVLEALLERTTRRMKNILLDKVPRYSLTIWAYGSMRSYDEEKQGDKWFISSILHKSLSFCWVNNLPFCPLTLAEGKEKVRVKAIVSWFSNHQSQMAFETESRRG